MMAGSGCGESRVSPDYVIRSRSVRPMRYVIALAVALALALIPLGTGSAQQRTAWVAYLSGAEEVPPINTQATGQVTFELNAQRTAITYHVIVNNLNNVMMGHIHVGAAGQNGGVAVWLYPA